MSCPSVRRASLWFLTTFDDSSYQAGYRCRCCDGILSHIYVRPSSEIGNSRFPRPTEAIEVAFSLHDGVLETPCLSRWGRPLVRASRLGFRCDATPPARRPFSVVSVNILALEEVASALGRSGEIDNVYHELRLILHRQDPLARELVVVFRVFDDGIGFRYEWPEQPNLKDLNIDDELTEFAAGRRLLRLVDSCLWPQHYEYLYKKSPISELNKVHTPPQSKCQRHLLLASTKPHLPTTPAWLAGKGDLTLKADLAPWSDGSQSPRCHFARLGGRFKSQTTLAT